jgi:hypothetical protein
LHTYLVGKDNELGNPVLEYNTIITHLMCTYVSNCPHDNLGETMPQELCIEPVTLRTVLCRMTHIS